MRDGRLDLRIQGKYGDQVPPFPTIISGSLPAEAGIAGKIGPGHLLDTDLQSTNRKINLSLSSIY